MVENNTDTERDIALTELARQVLRLKTLKTQHTGDDFTELAVWNIKAALEIAYQYGRERERREVP